MDVELRIPCLKHQIFIFELDRGIGVSFPVREESRDNDWTGDRGGGEKARCVTIMRRDEARRDISTQLVCPLHTFIDQKRQLYKRNVYMDRIVEKYSTLAFIRWKEHHTYVAYRLDNTSPTQLTNGIVKQIHDYLL